MQMLLYPKIFENKLKAQALNVFYTTDIRPLFEYKRQDVNCGFPKKVGGWGFPLIGMVLILGGELSVLLSVQAYSCLIHRYIVTSGTSSTSVSHLHRHTVKWLTPQMPDISSKSMQLRSAPSVSILAQNLTTS